MMQTPRGCAVVLVVGLAVLVAVVLLFADPQPCTGVGP